MATESLRTLASHLGIPERTVRRAAAEGLIRGERKSPRRFRTSMREEAYLRSHWSLLCDARKALRTEPNVRLAVLFGSVAAGRDAPGSDVDILVVLADPSASRVAELTGRLERRVGRDVQLVRLQDAERAPDLMAGVLEEGRVLVDREGRWEQLKVSEPTWRDRAATEASLDDALSDLNL